MLCGSKVSSTSTGTICGRTVKIIDTPGFFDGFKSTEESFIELSEVLTLARDGIHAIAFVMGRYTTSCEETIKQLLLFKGVQPFMFVLLTHAENEGINKTTTDKYIEECLSFPDCPPGFQNLMDMVENRVVMLESVAFVANGYHKQKCEELIMMVENVFKINDNRVYTNVLLEHTAEVHKKAKLQQEKEVQETTQLLALNKEKIKQLKKQLMDDTTVTVNSKMIADEVAAFETGNKKLENKIEEIKDKNYLEKLTSNILKDEMLKSKSNSIAGFVREFVSLLTFAAGMSTVAVPLAITGGNIGRFAGSIFPRISPKAEDVGIQLGFILGGILGHHLCIRAADKMYDSCKTQ